MTINARTEIYCILGNPVRHSLSPVIHNTAFKKMGINALYCAFTPASIKSGLEAVRTLGIKGASITIPFKSDAVRYVDELDEMAEMTGSINTVVNRDGKLIGYNTDGYGALKSLGDCGIEVRGKTIIVIGNGGSARAIAFILLKEGAAVVIAGRNGKNVDSLTDELKERFDTVSGTLIASLDAESVMNADVLINTTPIGMVPDTGQTPIDPGLLDRELTVFDIVYSPHTTRLLKEAGKKGCRIIHGIDMLINQGARQFEIWTGFTAPVKEISRALRNKSARTQ